MKSVAKCRRVEFFGYPEFKITRREYELEENLDCCTSEHIDWDKHDDGLGRSGIEPPTLER